MEKQHTGFTGEMHELIFPLQNIHKCMLNFRIDNKTKTLRIFRDGLTYLGSVWSLWNIRTILSDIPCSKDGGTEHVCEFCTETFRTRSY